MKDIRPQFTEEEYNCLRAEADRLGVSLKQLVHDRAIGIDSENTPLNLAKRLSEEVSVCRRDINKIIQRETRSEFGLYEDDIIRLEMSMCELEGIVTAFVGEVLRRVKRNGDSNI